MSIFDPIVRQDDSSRSTPTSAKDLYFFRPGQESRMQARCQFRIDKLGRCTAALTYPVKGMPWRRNTTRTCEFALDSDTRALLFAEVARLRKEAPKECLADDMLWSDTTEAGNAITRERTSGKLCVEIAVIKKGGELEERFSMREDSPAFLSSALCKTITALIQPHEKL